MNLYIKQHVFSWGDKFSIYDEAGRETYLVEGEVFTLGKKLHLYDLQRRELIYIERELWTFLPKYHIYKDGREAAEITKEFTFFRQEYTVSGPGWEVQGDFWSHEYRITCNGSEIASVSKEWMTWGDTYEIRLPEGTDELMALGVVLVIDACLAEQSRSS